MLRQAIAALADVSKLLGAKVDLLWERMDLDGLLFTLLLHDEQTGPIFAKLITSATGILAGISEGQPRLPTELMVVEEKQEALFDWCYRLKACRLASRGHPSCG